MIGSMFFKCLIAHVVHESIDFNFFIAFCFCPGGMLVSLRWQWVSK